MTPKRIKPVKVDGWMVKDAFLNVCTVFPDELRASYHAEQVSRYNKKTKAIPVLITDARKKGRG